MSRTSSDEYRDGRLWDGYDYDRQACEFCGGTGKKPDPKASTGFIVCAGCKGDKVH